MDEARSYWPLGHDELRSYYKLEKAARPLENPSISVTVSTRLDASADSPQFAKLGCVGGIET